MLKMKMRQSIVDDEFWTPRPLYESLIEKYDFNPILDVAATKENKRCSLFLTDALHKSWNYAGQDVWCNPPHSMTDDFIARAEQQFNRWRMKIMMIVPANVGGTIMFQKYVEGHREYHFIAGRPKFLKFGRPSKYPSRNSYIVILWR